MLKLKLTKREKMRQVVASAIGVFESKTQEGRWHIWNFNGVPYLMDTALIDFKDSDMYPEHEVDIWIWQGTGRGWISGVWGEWHPDYADRNTYLKTWKTLNRRRFVTGGVMYTTQALPFKACVCNVEDIESTFWQRVMADRQVKK